MEILGGVRLDGDILRQDLKLSPVVTALLSLTHKSAKKALWLGLPPSPQSRK